MYATIVMAMNLIKRMERLKNYLDEKGYTKDIDEDVFIHAIMILEGMNHKTATKWMRQFCDVNLLEYKNFKVNFTKEA